jgi:hypothetical protein
MSATKHRILEAERVRRSILRRGKLDGEQRRLREEISRLRALVEGLESCIEARVPCSENARAVADASTRLVGSAARSDVHLMDDDR